MEFKKFLEMVNEAESTAEKDDNAKKAGEKVTKDIEYDEGHKASDDERAEKAGKKVAADIRYDNKKMKSLKEYFEETEQQIINEGQFPIPVVGPDNKPVPGQAGFLNVSVPGQAGVAVNDMLRRLGARGLSIILPPNRIQQQQQQAALAAAKRASVQTSGKQVAEETVDEAANPSPEFKQDTITVWDGRGKREIPSQNPFPPARMPTLPAPSEREILDKLKKLPGYPYPDPKDDKFKYLPGYLDSDPRVPARPSPGDPGGKPPGIVGRPSDDRWGRPPDDANYGKNPKLPDIGTIAPGFTPPMAQPLPEPPAARPLPPAARPPSRIDAQPLPEPPAAPEAPTTPEPPKSQTQPDEIDRIKSLAGMSDEERYGKVGAEIRRLDPEAYKNRPRTYQGNIDLLNKLRAQKAGDSTAPAGDQKPADVKADEKPADAKADEKPEQPADAADELEPVTVTGNRTQPKDQDKEGDAELGRLLNLSGATTYDELNNWMKNRDKPAGDTEEPKAAEPAEPETKPEEPAVDAAGEEPAEPAEPADAAGEEPAAAAPNVKTSYRVVDPSTGRATNVSKEKYDQMVARGQIDKNKDLDYQFKVRNPDGSIRTVKQGDPDWQKYADQAQGTIAANYNQLQGDKKKKGSDEEEGERLAQTSEPEDSGEEGEEKEDRPSLFRRLFNIGKDDEGYYLGKKRGRDNEPETKTAKNVEIGDIDDLVGLPRGTIGESKLNEKAVSKKQQKFMGMVHAAQKGKKPASAEVAKVAKSMKPKDVKDFAKTKHEGLPEKKKKANEAEIPKSGPDYGAGLGAGRSDNVLEAKPDFIDLDNDGNKKESMKKAAADKKKKKVNESMSNLLKAAYSEGYVHGLREQPCRVKHYEDMEEAKHYFEGYKCGLEECYGLVPGRGYVDEETSQDVVDDMASFGAVDENTNQMAAVPVQKPQAQQVNTSATQPAQQTNVPVKPVATAMPQQPQMNVGGISTTKPDGSSNMGAVMQSRSNLSNIGQQAAQQMQEDDLDEMDKGDWLKHKAKTTPGDTFKAFGQTFKDKDVSETYAFEDLENQLSALLTESKVVNEGLSVSMSTGQQGSPDSVSVTATDGDSEKLLAFIKQVGLGGLADKVEPIDTPAEPAVAVVSDYGAPKFGGHDMPSMDDLLSKLTGIESHDHGHDHGDEEHTCNECGMMESSCGCEKKTEEVLETTIEAQIKSDQLDEAAPALAALGRLAGLAGRAALANPVKTAMLAKRAASAFKKDKEEVDETETLDQREFMVAEDDGEGYEQSQADAGKIDSALAVSGASKGGATNEDAGDVNSSMKDIMSKLDDIDKPDSPEAEVVSLPGAENLGKGADGMPEFDVKNQSSNTSSYEVDGKPASKAEYDNAMKNFKMPTMPTMPNMTMPSMPDNVGNSPYTVKVADNNFADIYKNMTDKMLDKIAAMTQNMGGALGKMGQSFGNRGQGDEKYITLPNGSKVNMKDFDQFILPPVEVTGIRKGDKSQSKPGDVQLGHLLNLSGANTYDELLNWLKTRDGYKLSSSPDELEPVTIQSKKKDNTSTLPPTDDMLQPVKVTGRRKIDEPDSDELKAQLDAMLKDMPGMNDEIKLDEWANDAGQKGTDASFTRDTDFMTQTISGGLNKPKSTGQTTIPVVAGQEAREGDEDVQAWKKLAGLAK